MKPKKFKLKRLPNRSPWSLSAYWDDGLYTPWDAVKPNDITQATWHAQELKEIKRERYHRQATRPNQRTP